MLILICPVLTNTSIVYYTWLQVSLHAWSHCTAKNAKKVKTSLCIISRSNTVKEKEFLQYDQPVATPQ